MEAILTGQEGLLCHMDDVLIFGRTQQEHDARLHAALQKVQSAGVTLNKDKCEFSRNCLVFLGHIIDGTGVSPDPQKTIVAMEKLTTLTQLRRFTGTVTQLEKFSSNIADISQPPRGHGYGVPLMMKPSRDLRPSSHSQLSSYFMKLVTRSQQTLQPMD